jgi:hypothetical protein
MPTVYINLGYFLTLGDLPFPLMLARLFLDGGWVVVLIFMIQTGWTLWVQSHQIKYNSGISYSLLAIDVPKMNEQTPKAVEQIFAQMAGAYSGLDNIEKYWIGKTQAVFSFEIVSIDGYVQFLVHTPNKYRDLIEAAFYSQYPDAAIVEVEDYANKVPLKFPNPEWDCWGTEFALKKPHALPLRTHVQFEHTLSEEYFKDPLSPLLEVFSSMKQGEQLWLQYLISPTDDSWKDESAALVDKIAGKKKPVKKTILDAVIDFPLVLLDEIGSAIWFDSEAGAPPPKKEEPKSKMMELTPGEKNLLEAIQMKASKHGFMTKIRMVYVAKRGVFNKGKVISPFKGALGQFTALDSNALKPYGKVTPKSDYAWERWSVPTKTTNIIRNYKNRSGKGAPPYVLNVEEMATLYHFPYHHIKAPLVKKTEAKRGEPPVSLPTAEVGGHKPFKAVVKALPPAAPPPPEPEEPDELDAALEDEGSELIE